MADFPLTDGLTFVEALHIDTGLTNLLSATTFAWQEITPATSNDTSWMLVTVAGHAYTGAETNEETSVDIAIGSPGNEQVIVEELRWHMGASTRKTPVYLLLPISIPGGSRLSARAYTTDTTSDNDCAVSVHLFKGSNLLANGPYSALKKIGSFTLDSGAVANTKSAWVEVAASADESYRGLFFHGYNDVAIHSSGRSHMIDLGIGSIGGEQVIIPDFFMGGGTFADELLPFGSPVFPVEIPGGARVVARSQTNGTTENLREIHAGLWGLV